MPATRIPMRQITEILRLKFEAKLSNEKVARACGVSKGVVCGEKVQEGLFFSQTFSSGTLFLAAPVCDQAFALFR